MKKHLYPVKKETLFTPEDVEEIRRRERDKKNGVVGISIGIIVGSLFMYWFFTLWGGEWEIYENYEGLKRDFIPDEKIIWMMLCLWIFAGIIWFSSSKDEF